MKFLAIAFLVFSLWDLHAEDRIYGYRGYAPGVTSEAINSMAIRSDGRYLFYSTGSASFRALDLLDMARIGDSAVATNGTVFNVTLLNDRRLVATTSSGVQYFNVEYPYSVSLESGQYIRETSINTTVLDACVGPSQTIYTLERSSSENQHIVRTVNATQAGATYLWTSLFSGAPTNLNPVAIRCGPSTVYVLASRSDTSGRETEFWVSFLSGSSGARSFSVFSPNPSSGVDSLVYDRKNFVLSPKGDQLLFLFNKRSDQRTQIERSNSKVEVVSMAGVFSVDVGSDGRLLASFTDNSQDYHGLFLIYDLINHPSDYSSYLERFLFLPAATLTASCQSGPLSCFGKSGLGLMPSGTTASTTKLNSLWVSSTADHYKFGTGEGSGLVLISKAPSLLFTSNPMGQDLVAAQSLSFGLVSDSNLNLEFRIDEDADSRGSFSGLTKTPGKLVKAESLLANTAKNFSITTSDLGITKNQTHSLMIFGVAPDDGSAGLTARTGFTFLYDPPPGKVLHFRTAWGDQAVAAVFDLPPDGDLQTVLVHFSYDVNDLADSKLPISMDTLATNTITIQSVTGANIVSPAKIAASDWRGRYVIAPIANGRSLYMRPQLIDKKNQFSTVNVEALSEAPARTLTIPEALGSAASCALEPRGQMKCLDLLVVFVGSLLGLGLRFRAKKLGPALLRNRRGGD